MAGKSRLSIPSFTDLPFGADKFRMTLADPFGLGLHMIPFIFAPGGSWSLFRGPNTKPLSTQAAMESVTCAAYSNALGALLLQVCSLN